jgi:hypothetical protein
MDIDMQSFKYFPELVSLVSSRLPIFIVPSRVKLCLPNLRVLARTKDGLACLSKDQTPSRMETSLGAHGIKLKRISTQLSNSAAKVAAG